MLLVKLTSGALLYALIVSTTSCSVMEKMMKDVLEQATKTGNQESGSPQQKKDVSSDANQDLAKEEKQAANDKSQKTQDTIPQIRNELPADMAVSQETRAPEDNKQTGSNITGWKLVTWSKGFSAAYVINEDLIIAGSSGGNTANSGGLYYSSDKGQSWTQTVTNIANIHAIHFVDGNTGWAVGGFSGMGVDMFIGMTSNGGKSWQNLNDNFKKSLNYEGYEPLWGLWVLDATNICAAGGAHVYRSNDGGNSWKASTRFTFDNSNYERIEGKTIQFVDSRTGYIATNRRLFKSIDGGMSWAQGTVFPWLTEDPSAFVDTKCIVAAWGEEVLAGVYSNCASGPGKYRIYKTSDGGRTWQLTATPSFEPAGFYPLDDGLITSGWGKLFLSKDALKSWSDLFDTKQNCRIIFLPSGLDRRIGMLVADGTGINGFLSPARPTDVRPEITKVDEKKPETDLPELHTRTKMGNFTAKNPEVIFERLTITATGRLTADIECKITLKKESEVEQPSIPVLQVLGLHTT